MAKRAWLRFAFLVVVMIIGGLAPRSPVAQDKKSKDEEKSTEEDEWVPPSICELLEYRYEPICRDPTILPDHPRRADILGTIRSNKDVRADCAKQLTSKSVSN